MQTHDFFTRLAAFNDCGPNMNSRPGDEPEMVFVCSHCDTPHDDEYDARDCCRPDVYERYRCTVCRTVHREEGDAHSCCPSVAHGQPMQCPICLQGADSFQIAADCCLHTHPTMTALGRERVADDVERGTPWPDAIRAHAFH